MKQKLSSKHNPGAPTFVDLFCGCGGCSCGFAQAGCEILAGIDLNKDALKTYQHNIGNAIMADVRFLPLKVGLAPTAVHFSPPCQGYSIANSTKWDKNGNLKPKYRFLNSLMMYGAIAIEQLQPEFITMENVPPAAKSLEFMRMTFFLRFESTTIYELSWRCLDAADYGVPQHRNRLWMVGKKLQIIGMIHFSASLSIGQFNELTLDELPLPDNENQSQLWEFT